MPVGFEPPQLLRQKLFYRGRKFNFEVNRLRLPNKRRESGSAFGIQAVL